MSGNAGVMGRVLGVAVPRSPASFELIAAGMAQHVGPDAAELGLLTRKPDNVVDGLAGQLGLPFGQEQTSIKRTSFLVSCSFKMGHRYYLVNLTAWRRRKLVPKHCWRQRRSHHQGTVGGY